MKIEITGVKLACLGIVTLILVGCNSHATPEPSSTLSATTSPISIASPVLQTETPSLPPSRIAPTATETLTPRPLTMTPTLLPTLTADEREQKVRELLKTNAGCKLPCWWGITPGKTTWTEAERFLLSLGATIGNTPDPSGTIFHGTGGFDFAGRGIDNSIGFDERTGIVESIFIHAEGYNDPLQFQALWAQHSVQNIISTYGQPTRVWLQTAGHFTEPPGGKEMGYTLWLFYDNMGILVRSLGRVRYAPIYHICPAVQNEAEGMIRMDMYLQSPDNPTSLEVASGTERRPEEKEFIRTIQEATGLSVEQFYKLFTQKDKPACFDTPRDIWP